MRARLLALSVLIPAIGAGCPPIPMDIAPPADDDDDVCFGCGPDGDADTDADADGDADLSVEREQVLAALCLSVQAYVCQGDVACCAGGWSVDAQAVCDETALAYCDLTYGEAVRTGRVAVDADLIAPCFEGLRDAVIATCPSAGPVAAPTPEACFGLFEGAVAEGFTCGVGAECLEGLDCVFDERWAEYGVCGHAPGEGQACSWSCAYGLSCVDGFCARPHGLRSMCSVSADGSSDNCGQGLYCDATGVCVGRLSDGAACDTNRACFGDCVEGTCWTDPFDYCWPEA